MSWLRCWRRWFRSCEWMTVCSLLGLPWSLEKRTDSVYCVFDGSSGAPYITSRHCGCGNLEVFGILNYWIPNRWIETILPKIHGAIPSSLPAFSCQQSYGSFFKVPFDFIKILNWFVGLCWCNLVIIWIWNLWRVWWNIHRWTVSSWPSKAYLNIRPWFGWEGFYISVDSINNACRAGPMRSNFLGDSHQQISWTSNSSRNKYLMLNVRSWNQFKVKWFKDHWNVSRRQVRKKCAMFEPSSLLKHWLLLLY